MSKNISTLPSGKPMYLRKRNGLLKRMKQHYMLYLFLLPMVILTLWFSYLPMIGILYAFKVDVNVMRYGAFEGFMRGTWSLNNFTTLFSNPDFLNALKNTIVLSLMKIVLIFPIPIMFAIMLTEMKLKKLSKVVQSLIFLPHFLSWAVISGMFFKILDPVNGAVNNILGALFPSYTGVYFMNEPALFKWMMVFTALWKEAGWGSIVYIASISAIDTSYYEAAKIDGASKMRQIFSITIPLLAPIIAVMFVLRLGGVMDAGFEQVFMMKLPGTEKVADIIGTFVYRMKLNSEYTFATAVGLFNSLVALVLVVSGNMFVKKAFNYKIW